MPGTRLVAIACEGPQDLGASVSGHFGHAPFFMLAELDGATVLSTRLVTPPAHGEGGCSAPQFLRQLGAKSVVVGGLGARAADVLESFGIEVIGGVSGNASEALKALAAGSLVKGDSTCAGHGTDGHNCGHHE